ncbi:pentapeptide repeat-containing protein [Bradyrhizobium manausense]|uniref:pentapeptide repeat-containing protein n=1 Tax=Bradyrhizobium manausense TaxID=989370 RepID=UPI001BAD0AF4|nr:pentapeptide repeat-containing protein [Bradyrhizobium manausense]MBR0831689.1 pentapeptide repeat-containing protein [Bradyrhizobium manausense]
MTNTDPQRGWPLQIIGLFERPTSKISVPVSLLAVLLFVALVIVGFAAIVWLLVDLLSGDQKRAAEAAKAALPVLAGAVGLPLIIWRLVILDRQTRISEEKTQIDRETHYTSIFSRAVEQLGQTREIKRTVSINGASADTTMTVPNIEVRLGGIHSLARLAEESRRDAEKISNMLRSYVRENSWSDRSGNQLAKPNWTPENAWTWAGELGHNPRDQSALTASANWSKQIKSQLEELKNWTTSIPETRVDVNEATEALVLQLPSEDTWARPVFYDCLFVGRQFSQKLLSLINFKRCTFINCRFDATEQSLEINESVILDSSFNSKSADIQIMFSKLSGVVFRTADKAKIGVYYSDAFSLRIGGFPNRASFSDSTLFELRFRGTPTQRKDKITELRLDDTILVHARLEGLKLSSDSDLGYRCAVDITFADLDLSSVTNFDPERIPFANANARTVQPTSIERPPSWPRYRPRSDPPRSEQVNLPSS